MKFTFGKYHKIVTEVFVFQTSSNNSDGIILKHKKLRSKTIRNMLIRGDSLRKRVFMTSSSDEEDIPSSDDSSKKRTKEKVLEQKETPLPSVFSNSSSIGLGFQISQSSDTESNGLGYTRPKSSRNLDLETLSFEKVTKRNTFDLVLSPS